MNSRENRQRAQAVSLKRVFGLAELEDHLSSARLDLYLQLRIAVIAGFAADGCLSSERYQELLSNVLLDMDEMYRRPSM